MDPEDYDPEYPERDKDQMCRSMGVCVFTLGHLIKHSWEYV